jgi:arylsulfatase
MRDEVLRPWTDFYGEILAWRESVQEPYFLWVLLLEPHHPWLPPTEFQQWSSRIDKYRAFQQYFEMFTNGWEPDFEETVHERLVNLYDDSIRYGDAFLDRLQADLADDDPLFVVHADHGEEFGEHGRYGHQPYLTEALIHVPLVISGTEEPCRVETPVELRELTPTIADIAGVDSPFTGRKLLGENVDEQPWATSKVFTEEGRRAAVRTIDRKLLYEDDQMELIDVMLGECEKIDGSVGLDDVLTAHFADEREKRRIRASADGVVEGYV